VCIIHATNGKASLTHCPSLQLPIPHLLLRELIKRKASCNFRFLVYFEPFRQHRSGNGWPCCHFLHIIVIVEQHHLLIGQMVLQTLNGKKLLMHIKLEDAPCGFRCRYITTIEIFLISLASTTFPLVALSFWREISIVARSCLL
jgi:hypothetical protein